MAIRKNKIAKTTVVLNKILSTPLLVETMLPLAPPKALPIPEPFCCNKITTTNKVDKIIWIIFKIKLIFLYSYFYNYYGHIIQNLSENVK